MHLITHGEIFTAIAVCIGMADNVLLIKIVRPAWFRRPAFHDGSLDATLSTKGCKTFLLNFCRPSGIPKYRIGNGSNFPEK
jgi:hypothetical protein